MKNVETPVLGYQPSADLLRLLQGAEAYLFAAEEDFGISVVEAQACGVPVICFGRGGATESVIENKTGMFFHSQTPEAIDSAIKKFESVLVELSPITIRHNAEHFSIAVFRDWFMARLNSEMPISSVKQSSEIRSVSAAALH